VARGRSSRQRKARVVARRKANEYLQRYGRTSIAKVAKAAKVDHSTAQVALRQEQIGRADIGESVSSASPGNGYTKAINDTPKAVIDGTVMNTRMSVTNLRREAKVAAAHLLRTDLDADERQGLNMTIVIAATVDQHVPAFEAALAALDKPPLAKVVQNGAR
jgi:hypothetical protein